MTSMRVVSTFRPLPLEARHHRARPDFDWLAAIRMMSNSAAESCLCPVHVITDVDTDLPVPTLQYITTHRRLMLWSLEACLCYLQSPDFDRDTVMLDVDQLIYQDLSPWFIADLVVLIRPGKMSGNPLLNGVQWWRHDAKARLIAFYTAALRDAEQMSDDRIVWGADSDALRTLLAPFAVGTHRRAGLSVTMVDSDIVLQSFSTYQGAELRAGRAWRTNHAVLDFRGNRKEWMEACYVATHGVTA